MQCLFPIRIHHEGHRANEKIQVPCGKCVSCLSNRRSEWSYRLEQELKRSTSAFFITLTYEEGKTPLSPNKKPQLSKYDLQTFLKRVRKTYPHNSIRYFLVGEYGTTTKRPHYHGIFFNLPANCEEFIFDKWGKGFVYFGDVNSKSINYVTKYILSKSDFPEGCTKPFSLMSTKPGIGSNYLDLSTKYHKDTQHFFVTSLGNQKKRMPRYYINKIFDKDEREQNSKSVFDRIDQDRIKSVDSISTLQTNIAEQIEQARQHLERVKKSISKGKSI